MLAAEEHYQAAEAYMSAIDRSNDESVRAMISMVFGAFSYFSLLGKEDSSDAIQRALQSCEGIAA